MKMIPSEVHVRARSVPKPTDPRFNDRTAIFDWRDEVGEFGTDTTINSGDITAVVMLGLQGLDSQVREDRRTIEAQAKHIAELMRDREVQFARVDALDGRVAEIAELKAAVAEIAVLRRETASMPRLLERLDRDTPLNTAAR